MIRIAPTIFVMLLVSACNGITNFEDELDGPEAVAWQTCVEEGFGFLPDSPPNHGESSEDWILFAWTPQGVKASGGAVSCKTTGDGKELLEVRISGLPFG